MLWRPLWESLLQWSWILKLFLQNKQWEVSNLSRPQATTPLLLSAHGNLFQATNILRAVGTSVTQPVEQGKALTDEISWILSPRNLSGDLSEWVKTRG